MYRGSILGAVTRSRFVGITPWPGSEREKAYIVFIIELSETGLCFGWFEWRCVRFFLKASTTKIAVFEVKCVFWPVDWN